MASRARRARPFALRSSAVHHEQGTTVMRALTVAWISLLTLPAAAVVYLGLLLWLACVRYPAQLLLRDRAFQANSVAAAFTMGAVLLLGSLAVKLERIYEFLAPVALETVRAEDQVMPDISQVSVEATASQESAQGLQAEVNITESEPMPVEDIEFAEALLLQSGNGSGSPFGTPDGRSLSRELGPTNRDSAKFFGVTAAGRKFVFVLDISGSMQGDRFARARYELRKSLAKIREHQSYSVLFYNGNLFSFTQEELVPGTKENLKRANRWIEKVRCNGNTNPVPAIALALQLEPDAIFLLTDGEFHGNELAQSYHLHEQSGLSIPIHTFGFVNRAGEPGLKALAERTNGYYQYIP